MQKPAAWKKYLSVSLLYLIATLVMFYPIVLHLNNFVSGLGSDTYQNLWSIWWVKYSVFYLHSNTFYTHLIHWPLGSSLAFETLAPLIGIVSAPFQIFGTVFAYNLIFLLGFVVSGISMFVLADYLTKNSYAAAIAGFAYTLAPSI